MNTAEQIAINLKAFRLINKRYNVAQVDLITIVFIGNRTLTNGYLTAHKFHYKLSHIINRGYIEQVQGKGKRFRVSDKGRDVLNQYYQLVDKLSEVKRSKQAIKSTINLI